MEQKTTCKICDHLLSPAKVQIEYNGRYEVGTHWFCVRGCYCSTAGCQPEFTLEDPPVVQHFRRPYASELQTLTLTELIILRDDVERIVRERSCPSKMGEFWCGRSKGHYEDHMTVIVDDDGRMRSVRWDA